MIIAPIININPFAYDLIKNGILKASKLSTSFKVHMKYVHSFFDKFSSKKDVHRPSSIVETTSLMNPLASLFP